jgi:hypothetical protein
MGASDCARLHSERLRQVEALTTTRLKLMNYWKCLLVRSVSKVSSCPQGTESRLLLLFSSGCPPSSTYVNVLLILPVFVPGVSAVLLPSILLQKKVN